MNEPADSSGRPWVLLVPLVTLVWGAYSVRVSRPDFEVAMQRAHQLWRVGAYEAAVGAYLELADTPGSGRWAAQALLEAARISYQNLDQQATAVHLLQRLITSFPGEPLAVRAHLLLAEIYANSLGDLGQAVEHWRDALGGGLSPEERLEVEFRLADVQFAEGRQADALAAFQQLAADPEAEPGLRCRAWFRIGTLLQLQREHEAAVAVFRKILADGDCRIDHVQASLAMIESLDVLDRLDEAIETAKNINPEEYPAESLRRLIERLEQKQSYYKQELWDSY